jgi:hypothetical protein
MTEPTPLPFDVNVTDSPIDGITPNHRASADGPSIVAPWKRQRSESTKNTRVKAPKKPAPAYHEGMFIEPIEGLYLTGAAMVMPFKPAVAQYLMMPGMEMGPDNEPVYTVTGARKCAEAWDKAAKESESVRRFLSGLTTATVWGALISAHLPIVLILLGDKLLGGGDPTAGIQEFLKRRAESPEPE